MVDPPYLDEHVRLMVTRAEISVLYPVESMNASVHANAQTHAGVDGPALTAVRVLLLASEQTPCARLEVNTLVREHILASRRTPGQAESDIVHEYMEREVRLELAMRSLELPEGSAEHLDRSLGELILAQEQALPASSPVMISLDAAPHRAVSVSHGDHMAAWSDVPDLGATLALYARRWPTLPALGSFVA